MVGHASGCFGYIKDWMEKKIRRHQMRARNRNVFSGNEWNMDWFYKSLGL